jgi:hypothetical protein
MPGGVLAANATPPGFRTEFKLKAEEEAAQAAPLI